MKMRIVLLICCSLATVFSAMAQSLTVTNADLAKYAAARQKAERDLRENYAKLGFSSPEERERRDAAAAKERAELAGRLRQEYEIQEQAAAQVEALRSQQARYDAYVRSTGYGGQQQDYYPGYVVYGYGQNRYRRPVYGPAWRADASGVVYEPGGRSSNIYSPTVVRPAPKPVFLPMRHR